MEHVTQAHMPSSDDPEPDPLASAAAGAPSKKPRLWPSIVQIFFVNLPTGRTIAVKSQPHGSVDDFKKPIETMERYQHYKQRLLLDGMKLMGPTPLSAYEIKEGTVLRLVCGMQIFVRTPCRMIVLDVDGGDFIEDARRLILDGVGITIQTQKLVHNGVVLMDGTEGT